MAMRVRATGSLPGKRDFDDLTQKLRIAVTAGVTGAAAGLQTDLRQTLGRLGPQWRKLGNAVRVQVYPKNRPSRAAAALIYANGERAAKALQAHDDGATIRSRSGKALAIPLHNYRGPKREKLGPQSSFFRGRLVFIPSKDRGGLEIGVLAMPATGTASAQRRQRNTKGRKAISERISKDLVPMFLLIRQVVLRSKFDGKALAQKWGEDVPALIAVQAKRLGIG